MFNSFSIVDLTSEFSVSRLLAVNHHSRILSGDTFQEGPNNNEHTFLVCRLAAFSIRIVGQGWPNKAGLFW